MIRTHETVCLLISIINDCCLYISQQFSYLYISQGLNGTDGRTDGPYAYVAYIMVLKSYILYRDFRRMGGVSVRVSVVAYIENGLYRDFDGRTHGTRSRCPSGKLVAA